jgi:hypothetical protein
MECVTAKDLRVDIHAIAPRRMKSIVHTFKEIKDLTSWSLFGSCIYTCPWRARSFWDCNMDLDFQERICMGRSCFQGNHHCRHHHPPSFRGTCTCIPYWDYCAVDTRVPCLHSKGWRQDFGIVVRTLRERLQYMLVEVHRNKLFGHNQAWLK